MFIWDSDEIGDETGWIFVNGVLEFMEIAGHVWNFASVVLVMHGLRYLICNEIVMGFKGK